MIKNYLTSLKQEFSGYITAKLMKDIMAGLTVCAVALPLALAFGVSSGATAAAGLVTAIIAGVVIAVLGGASFQISGPTGAMSAVLVGSNGRGQPGRSPADDQNINGKHAFSLLRHLVLP